MSWAHRDRSSRRRTFFGAPGLVVTAIVALLAATCVLLISAGATFPPVVAARPHPNTPLDLLNTLTGDPRREQGAAPPPRHQTAAQPPDRLADRPRPRPRRAASRAAGHRGAPHPRNGRGGTERRGGAFGGVEGNRGVGS